MPRQRWRAPQHQFPPVGDLRFRALELANERQLGDGPAFESAVQSPIQPAHPGVTVSIPCTTRPRPPRPGSTAVSAGLARLFTLASNALARCELLVATPLVALAGSTQTGHVRLHCARSTIGGQPSRVSARQPRPPKADRPADGSSRAISPAGVGRMTETPFILTSIRAARRCSTAAHDRTIDATDQQHRDRRRVSPVPPTRLRATLLWRIVKRVETKLPSH